MMMDHTNSIESESFVREWFYSTSIEPASNSPRLVLNSFGVENGRIPTFEPRFSTLSQLQIDLMMQRKSFKVVFEISKTPFDQI